MNRKILQNIIAAGILIFSVIPWPNLHVARALEDNPGAIDVVDDCNGLAEDEQAPDPGDVWPPDFEIRFPPLIPGPPGGKTHLGEIVYKVDNYLEGLRVSGFLASESQDPPEIRISGARSSINEDEELLLLGLPLNYKTQQDRLMESWWRIKQINGAEVPFSLNGIAAGGEEFVDDPIDDGTRCGVMQRIPQSGRDNDGDGMDDQWERRYCGTLECLDPDVDDDADGFVADYYESNVTGDIFRVAPNTSSARIIPGPTDFDTGDGEFTNLEEYLWGTNPIDPDSDDDGFPDEADVAGLGQFMIRFVPGEITGSELTIELNAMGEGGKFLRGPADELVTQITGYRTNITVNGRSNLDVALESSSLNPAQADTFRVTANPTTTQSELPRLDFLWDIRDLSQTPPDDEVEFDVPGAQCERLGFGNIMECTLDQNGSQGLGSVLRFNVIVSDSATGETAEGNIEVPVGGNVILSSDPTLVPQYVVDVKSDGEAVDRLERSIVWIEVKADLPGEDPSNYHFSWYFDDIPDYDRCTSVPITPKPIPNTLDTSIFQPCGVGTPYFYFLADKLNSHVYKVSTEVGSVATGNGYGAGSLEIFTDPTEATSQADAGGVEARSLMEIPETAALPNETVVAKSSYLERDPSRTYQYEWKLDGQEVQTEDPHELEFTAMPGKNTYSVELSVAEYKDGVLIAEHSDAGEVQVSDPLSTVASLQTSARAQISGVFEGTSFLWLKMISLAMIVMGGIIIARPSFSRAHTMQVNKRP